MYVQILARCRANASVLSRYACAASGLKTVRTGPPHLSCRLYMAVPSAPPGVCNTTVPSLVGSRQVAPVALTSNAKASASARGTAGRAGCGAGLAALKRDRWSRSSSSVEQRVTGSWDHWIKQTRTRAIREIAVVAQRNLGEISRDAAARPKNCSEAVTRPSAPLVSDGAPAAAPPAGRALAVWAQESLSGFLGSVGGP